MYFCFSLQQSPLLSITIAKSQRQLIVRNLFSSSSWSLKVKWHCTGSWRGLPRLMTQITVARMCGEKAHLRAEAEVEPGSIQSLLTTYLQWPWGLPVAPSSKGPHNYLFLPPKAQASSHSGSWSCSNHKQTIAEPNYYREALISEGNNVNIGLQCCSSYHHLSPSLQTCSSSVCTLMHCCCTWLSRVLREQNHLYMLKWFLQTWKCCHTSDDCEHPGKSHLQSLSTRYKAWAVSKR